MRIFLIILDGVGIGALPDAAEYGDAGTNTLLHVAEAVGGLRLPNLEKLGLGRLLDLPGVRPIADPSGARGRLGQLSKGKDSTVGHWELAGHVTEQRLPDLPAGLPGGAARSLGPARRPRLDGERRGLGHRHHRALRRGASTHRPVHRVHFRRQRLPGRGARGDRAARGALRGLPPCPRAARRRARRRPRDRAALHRGARELPAHAEPAGLLARAARSPRCSTGWSRGASRWSPWARWTTCSPGAA